MWRRSAQIQRAAASGSRSQTSLASNTSNNSNSSAPQQPSTSSPNLLSSFESASQHPIVRWFRGESSPVTSPVSSPPSTLREALEDDFPGSPTSLHSAPSGFELQRPPPACLPQHLNGRAAVHRSPPFLESLARSALPTATVTRPPPVLRQQTGHSVALSDEGFDVEGADADAPCLDITQSPPTRTSIDSLRHLRDRGIPVSVGTDAPGHARSYSTSSPTRWWFGKERKADVDELLDESDQADTIESEEAHMRKKCTSHSMLAHSLNLTNASQILRQRTPWCFAMACSVSTMSRSVPPLPP